MRIQVELDEWGMKQVDEIKSHTGISTYKDLFDNALTLLSWAVTQRQNGRIVASIDESSQEFRELHMPSLERAAQISEPKKGVA